MMLKATDIDEIPMQLHLEWDRLPILSKAKIHLMHMVYLLLA